MPENMPKASMLPVPIIFNMLLDYQLLLLDIIFTEKSSNFTSKHKDTENLLNK